MSPTAMLSSKVMDRGVTIKFSGNSDTGYKGTARWFNNTDEYYVELEKNRDDSEVVITTSTVTHSLPKGGPFCTDLEDNVTEELKLLFTTAITLSRIV